MIIHSPVISGSMTFASGSTVTYPDGGVYSGSFSGSFQGDGSNLVLAGGVVSGSSQVTESLDLRYVNLTESASLSITGSFSGSVNVTSDNLVINGGTFTAFSSSVSSSIGGISTDFKDFSGAVTASDVSASGNIYGGLTQVGALAVDTNTLTANVTSNMVGVGTTTPSNPFSLGDQTLVVNSSVGNTTGVFQLQNNGNGEITIYGYNGAAIIQPSGSMDLVLYADNGNKGLTLGANGTASMDMHLLPDANITYDLGSPTKRWRDIYLSGNTMNLGGNKITSDGNGLNFSDADGNPVGLTTGEVIVSGSGGTVTLGIDAEGNLSQTNTATGVSGSSAKINDTDGTLPYRSGSNFGDSILSQNGSVLTIAGNLVPDNTSRTLGTAALPFQDLYLSSASLYINGQQVLSTDGTELTIATDAGESIKILETGNDTITLQTANGDITLASSGTGNIEFDAPIQIAAGNNILSSDGNAISFASDVSLGSNKIYAGNLANVVSGSQQVIDLLPTGTVSGSAQTIANLPTGTVSGSIQVLGGTGILSSSTDDFLSFSASVATTFGGLSTDYNDLQNIPAGIISSSAITYSGNDVTVLGNLTVQGDTTTLNTSTLIVEDKLITLASGSADASAATGAGIEVDGAYGIGGQNKASLTYDGSGWKSNVNLTMSGSATFTSNAISIGTLNGNGGLVEVGGSTDFRIPKDKLQIGSTAVTTTAAELNLLDTAVAGTIVNSKAVIYGSGGEVNATKLQVGGVDITSTPAELNLLDGVAGLVQADFTKLAAIDATATELNYVDGVTSNIQTQLNSKLSGSGQVVLENADKTGFTGASSITTLGTIGTGVWQGSVISSQYLDADPLPAGTVTGSVQIDHDATTNFVANEHIDHSTVSITAGAGLTGGGTIDATRTINVGAGEGITVNANDIALSGTYTGTWAVTGAITATGDITAYASSDERLKDNIEIITNPIGKVKALKGVTWEWNDNASDIQKSLPNVGVIAQDVEMVLPQLVRENDGGYKAVDYDKIVGLLIEAIKDQQKQIDDLKSKLG